MSGAVTECGAETVHLEDAPCRRIHHRRLDARPHGREGGTLCLEHCCMQLTGLG